MEVIFMPEFPEMVWKDRVSSELDELRRNNLLGNDPVIDSENNVEIIINLKAWGFIKEDNQPKPQKSHQFLVKINRSYPHMGSVEILWNSIIFHPNIHPLELKDGKSGTGHIGGNILRDWTRASDLLTVVRSLKMLVENPNNNAPLIYEECLEAAKYFKANPIYQLRKQYNLNDQGLEDEFPIKIWKERIEREIIGLKSYDELKNCKVITQTESYFDIIITFNASGFVKDGSDIKPQEAHQICVKINRKYPFFGGANYKWHSNIFHPNIHPVVLSEEKNGTGEINLNFRGPWTQHLNLTDSIITLKNLVEGPRVSKPLNHKACLEAADFFKSDSKFRKLYNIKDNDDDVIKIP